MELVESPSHHGSWTVSSANDRSKDSPIDLEISSDPEKTFLTIKKIWRLKSLNIITSSKYGRYIYIIRRFHVFLLTFLHRNRSANILRIDERTGKVKVISRGRIGSESGSNPKAQNLHAKWDKWIYFIIDLRHHLNIFLSITSTNQSLDRLCCIVRRVGKYLP